MYFFIMRPAYKTKEEGKKSDQINRFPFVFILNNEFLGPAFQSFPFDTGAAAEGIFSDKADPFVFLEDYEIGTSNEEINSHITWAFGGLKRYFHGEVKADLRNTLRPWDSTESSFLDIAQMGSYRHNTPDRRASSVELSYRSNIPLKEHAELAIVPKQFLEFGDDKNIEVLDRLHELSIGWDVYDWQPNLRPRDFYDNIERIAERRYEDTGVF